MLTGLLNDIVLWDKVLVTDITICDKPICRYGWAFMLHALHMHLKYRVTQKKRSSPKLE